MTILVFCLVALAGPLLAHFDPGTKVRQFVITTEETTTEIHIRTPLPLLFGDILTGAAPDEHGFLINRGTAETPVYALSTEAVAAHRAAFAARLADSLTWKIGTQDGSPRVRAYRILSELPLQALVSPAAARDSLRQPDATGEVPISDGYVDMTVSLGFAATDAPLVVQSGFPALDLPEDVAIDNHIIDHRVSPSRSLVRGGQLAQVLVLPTSQIGVALEYAYQGVLHILEGLDHVLLVVAMALGAVGGWGLVRNVTAFTLGHAVTLVAGFLGYVPTSGWFIPAIEAAIAATIIMAALASLRGTRSSALLYTGIGLLHGFGFSFVLGNVLGPDSPELVQALAAFTVGIEIGQLMIVVVVLAVFAGLAHISRNWTLRLKQAALIAMGSVAAFMLIERVPVIFA
ncbi:HupE/UreJ family protein [Tropicibacter alexandrii]|uniref:HupE/UreJ family protein n=1 Tax=Tropicibacter alexandrii TaxID=2267683 RepID=UPI000EF52FF5|nr:HupE/UreJ family protein [Tropicibacter alexandrii]